MTVLESDTQAAAADADLKAENSKSAARSGGISNAMTVDVEDFFHVQAFAGCIDRKDWESLPRRVEMNTEKVLGLFAEARVSATFFVLGWVAERHPGLVRKIVAEGHELASHGYDHIRVHEQTADAFRSDVRRTKQLLEDTGGVPVHGYRAASFSIGANTLWALDVLAEEGYQYSSSIYPIAHDFYGMPSAPRFAFHPRHDRFIEVPMTTLSMFGRNFPCSGGGYFRLVPYSVSRWALGRVNEHDRQACIFYFHPWEIDPEQPRPHGAPLKSRLRHYVNLHRMEGRLRCLLRDFTWERMDRVFLNACAQ